MDDIKQNRGIFGGEEFAVEAGDRSDCVSSSLWPEKLLNQSNTSVGSSCSVLELEGSFGFFLCYFSSFWFVWNVPLMMCKDQTDDTSV